MFETIEQAQWIIGRQAMIFNADQGPVFLQNIEEVADEPHKQNEHYFRLRIIDKNGCFAICSPVTLVLILEEDLRFGRAHRMEKRRMSFAATELMNQIRREIREREKEEIRLQKERSLHECRSDSLGDLIKTAQDGLDKNYEEEDVEAGLDQETDDSLEKLL